MARKTKKFVMDGSEIIEGLALIAKEKNISLDLAVESLEEGISQAAKRGLKNPPKVGVDIDRETGQISAYTYQLVVEEDDFEDLYGEIPLEEAQEDIDDTLVVGDEVIIDEEVDISQFGRSAIQIAKQIIMQKVREHERLKVFNDYSDRIGEMMNGTVQQVERGNVIINLGRTEALLPRSQQIRGERYHQGETVKGVIVEVKDNVKGAQVILSRTDPEFLKRLFEMEVPEVFEGIVTITHVVRSPGYRAKLAVESNDPRVDPVGACVGMRGNRIQAVVRELSNERMDIINWSDDMSILVRRALASADVKRVFPVGDTRVVILVADEDLAKAIGRDGQNIRLTSKFIDRTVEIFGEDEFEDLSEEERTRVLTEDPVEMIDSDEIIDDETIGEDEAHVLADDSDVEEDEVAVATIDAAESDTPADEEEETDA
jgi:N utilization substance protein A